MQSTHLASERIVQGPPHLPEDLWRYIANIMPLRDWVKASSTCKTLYELHPLETTVCTVSVAGMWTSQSALLWLVRHWHACTHLKVDVEANSICMEGDITLVQNAPRSPLGYVASLKTLRLYCSFIYQSKDIEHAWTRWLENFLLLVAPISIKVLEIQRRCLPSLPVMPHLKHLILHGYGCYRILETLMGLQTLETVKMEGVPGIFLISGSTIRFPPSLRRLYLHQISFTVPMYLPDGCTIKFSAMLYPLQQALPQLDGLEKRLESLTVLDSSIRGELCSWTCQSLRLRLAGLKRLNLYIQGDVSLVSDSHVPFWSYLPNLCDLDITGTQISLCIPAQCQLKRVCARAKRGLKLSFEDAGVTAANLIAFDVRFSIRYLQPSDITSWKIFTEGLEGRGIGLVKDKIDVGLLRWRMSHQHPDQLTGWEMACDCHCCWECLTRAGVV